VISTIETFVLGPFQTNCYLIRCGRECWVVDPGMGPGVLLRRLRGETLSPGRILLTHGHGDHIAGVRELKEAFPGVRLCCPAGDAFMLADAQANLSGMFGVPLTCPAADDLLEIGQTLTCGQSLWTVLDTSGHTPGGVSFHCAEAAAVITGDSLFAGSIGRVDLPGAGAERLMRNIRTHLLTLPEGTRVLPGHGPGTTIGTEKRMNPFFEDH